MSLRAEVIIPLALDGTFSYILPQELSERFPNFAIGMRVVVPFGKKRYYTGIVCALHKEDLKSSLKEIEQVLDEEPLISYGNGSPIITAVRSGPSFVKLFLQVFSQKVRRTTV